jgi:hypothetical protein
VEVYRAAKVDLSHCHIHVNMPQANALCTRDSGTVIRARTCSVQGNVHRGAHTQLECANMPVGHPEIEREAREGAAAGPERFVELVGRAIAAMQGRGEAAPVV